MGNGAVFVHSGLMSDMNDDELAIVLGHELAHYTHEHSRKGMKRALITQLIAVGVAAAAETIDDDKTRAVVGLATMFSSLAVTNGYGRDLEDQADRVGLRYAHEGGFDVRHGPRVWERFRQKYGEENRVANFFFSNHSQASARQRNLQREIALNYHRRALRARDRALPRCGRGPLVLAGPVTGGASRPTSLVAAPWHNASHRQRLTDRASRGPAPAPRAPPQRDTAGTRQGPGVVWATPNNWLAAEGTIKAPATGSARHADGSQPDASLQRRGHRICTRRAPSARRTPISRRALGHDQRHHPVDADAREQQRQAAEHGGQRQHEATLAHRRRPHLHHRPHVEYRRSPRSTPSIAARTVSPSAAGSPVARIARNGATGGPCTPWM